MKKLSTTKRIVSFLAVFFVLFLIVWFSRDSEIKQEPKVSGSIIDIIERDDGSFKVENHEDGYEVVVPGGWEIDQTKKQFYAPEFLDQVGGMKISCDYTDQEVENLTQKQEQILETLDKIYGDEIEIIKNQIIEEPFEGLEIETKNYFGHVLSVYFLRNNKEFSCSFYFEDDTDEQAAIREEFLNTLKFYEE